MGNKQTFKEEIGYAQTRAVDYEAQEKLRVQFGLPSILDINPIAQEKIMEKMLIRSSRKIDFHLRNKGMSNTKGGGLRKPNISSIGLTINSGCKPTSNMQNEMGTTVVYQTGPDVTTNLGQYLTR